MYTRSRLSIGTAALIAAGCLVFGAQCRTDSRGIRTPRSDPTPAGPIPGITFVPFNDKVIFASFAEIESIVGFDVLRADLERYAYEPFSRSWRQEGGSWRYYEAYSALDGPDQTVLIGVAQKPVTGGAMPSGWQPQTIEGWDALVRTRPGGRYEVRFLTGATTSLGVPVEAIVGGPDEVSVRKLISSLHFGD
jgi:hypothetical protein